MNSVVLGNPFFKKHNITIDPKNNLLQLPNLTVQLNKILPVQEVAKNPFYFDEESTNRKYYSNVFCRIFLTGINLVTDLLFLATVWKTNVDPHFISRQKSVTRVISKGNSVESRFSFQKN